MRVGLLVAVGLIAWVSGCALAGPEPDPSPPSPELPPPSLDRPAPDTVAAGVAVEGAAGPADGEVVPVDGVLPPVRALWVVRTALVHPDSVRAVVERAQRGGFNTLLVQIRGRGDAWYRSGREPRAELLAGAHPSYDPLAVMLDEARERGIAVHAWVNAHLVAGARTPPLDPLHLVNRRPEWLAVPRELARELFHMDPRDARYREALMAHVRANPDQVEGLYSSPMLSEATDHLAAVVAELVDAYELDGVHLDYLRLPSRSFDYSRGALEAFRAHLRARHPPGELRTAEARWREGEIFAYPDAFPRQWDAFRQEGVSGSLAAAVGAVRRVRPDLQVSVAVFPDPADARTHRFQDWEDWVARELVDAVAPMSYTNRNDAFALAMERARDAAGAHRVWMGVGAYTNSFDEAVRRARWVGAEGFRGMALFSYDWTVGAEGVRAAGGEAYLERFGQEAFKVGSGTPASGR